MKINAICFTENGSKVIEKLKSKLGDSLRSVYKSKNNNFPGLEEYNGEICDLAQECFERKVALVVVGAIGIAVRMIAPFVDDKTKDIPVIVIDEAARHVVPILSGHIGGANELAYILADILQCEAVITTATDVNQTLSIDVVARKLGLNIENKDAIKNVSGKILEGKPIVVAVKNYRPGMFTDVIVGDQNTECGESQALKLSTKKYVMGIGCKKGKNFEEIEEVVCKVLDDNNISISDIYAFASIDIKADEIGLIDFSRIHRLPFVTFEAKMLAMLEGEFSASEFVSSQVGVDNVCERSAMLLTDNQGRLVVKKQASNGVTVAIALRKGYC